jgi:hypothetical protein
VLERRLRLLAGSSRLDRRHKPCRQDFFQVVGRLASWPQAWDYFGDGFGARWAAAEEHTSIREGFFLAEGMFFFSRQNLRIIGARKKAEPYGLRPA